MFSPGVLTLSRECFAQLFDLDLLPAGYVIFVLRGPGQGGQENRSKNDFRESQVHGRAFMTYSTHRPIQQRTTIVVAPL